MEAVRTPPCANERTIVIRTDASAAIGTGHVRRCLALADALRSAGADPLFITRPHVHADGSIDTAAFIRAAGHRVIVLPAAQGSIAPTPDAPPHAAWGGVPQEQDAAETAALLVKVAPAAVIVDHYAFDARWHVRVAAARGTRLVAIDDLADRPLAVDLLIDHNVADDARAKYHGRVAPGVRLLAGPRFALIDAAYARAPRYVWRQEVEAIGIFMGGVDSAGLSRPIAVELRRAGYAGRILVAATSANPHVADLRAATTTERIELSVDLPDLAAFFGSADLQIGAAGGATWERCCLGAPSLAVVVADNQRVVIDALSSRGVVAQAPADPAAIAAAAMALTRDPAARCALSQAAAGLVDGHGAARAALAIGADALIVRSATIEDARLLHGWRNDPATRAVSRQADPIVFESHLAWLRGTLSRDDRFLLIAQIWDTPVGTVRFDLNETSAEVSIHLDPLLGGIGLGPRVLAAAEAAVAEKIDHAVTIHAETLPGNRASERLFEIMGYAGAPGRYMKQLQSAKTGSSCSA